MSTSFFIQNWLCYLFKNRFITFLFLVVFYNFVRYFYISGRGWAPTTSINESHPHSSGGVLILHDPPWGLVVVQKNYQITSSFSKSNGGVVVAATTTTSTPLSGGLSSYLLFKKYSWCILILKSISLFILFKNKYVLYQGHPQQVTPLVGGLRTCTYIIIILLCIIKL